MTNIVQSNSTYSHFNGGFSWACNLLSWATLEPTNTNRNVNYQRRTVLSTTGLRDRACSLGLGWPKPKVATLGDNLRAGLPWVAADGLGQIKRDQPLCVDRNRKHTEILERKQMDGRTLILSPSFVVDNQTQTKGSLGFLCTPLQAGLWQAIKHIGP